MSLYTLFAILYQESGRNLSIRIPAGTSVIRAKEFPRECYWARPWPSIKKREYEFLEMEGILLMPAEIGSDLPGLSGA